MARATDITWDGGEHPFLLTIELLRALQTKCDAGPPHVLGRLATHKWQVEDVYDTIRLGLEGGGMSKEDARKLVDRQLVDRKLGDFVPTAQMVLMSSLYTPDEDTPTGEAKAETESPT